jgi:hypothetical protein
MLPDDGGGGPAHRAVVSSKSAGEGREEAVAAGWGLIRLLRWAIGERLPWPATACGLWRILVQVSLHL